MDDNLIFCAQTAGLSNRLKGLVTSMRIAEKTGRQILLYWPKTFDVGSEFSELFNLRIKTTDQDPRENLKSSGTIICDSYEDCEKNPEKNWAIKSWRLFLFPNEVKRNFSKILSPKDGVAIDLEYERIPSKLRKKIFKHVKKLEPSKKINDKLNKFIKKESFENVIGLHVRRTDFQYTLDGRGKVSTNEKFFSQIDAIISKESKARFFLATDSKETEREFAKRFGEKIITYPKRGWDKSSSEFTQEALIELLLLSKTRKIIGTYLSTFTEMAWWLGGAKKGVTIIGDDSAKEEVNKNFQKLKNANRTPNALRNFLKSLRARSKIFRKILDACFELKIRIKKYLKI